METDDDQPSDFPKTCEHHLKCKSKELFLELVSDFKLVFQDGSFLTYPVKNPSMANVVSPGRPVGGDSGTSSNIEIQQQGCVFEC